MGEENGTKEAVSKLKEDRDMLFERIREIEINGTPYEHQIENEQKNMRKEVDAMKTTIEKIQQQQNRWMGALAILIPMVTVFLWAIAKKYI